jgi:hypothetical protein
MNAHVVNIDDGVDHHCLKEQFEDTKEVIKSRKTKKNRKYNDIKKLGINRPSPTFTVGNPAPGFAFILFTKKKKKKKKKIIYIL